MSNKVCDHCGTYETVGMRAIETVGKMTDDDECVLYVAAFGKAICAVAGAQIYSSSIHKLKGEGMGAAPHEWLAEAAMTFTQQRMAEIEDEVLEWFQANGKMALEKMNESIHRLHARRKAENDLSKGE